MSHPGGLDSALHHLISGAVREVGQEGTRPKLVVLPDGPDRFLHPALKLFWPRQFDRTDPPRPVYVPAADVIGRGVLAPQGISLLDMPSVIFFERLDEIEVDTSAQEAISHVVTMCARSSTFVFVSYSRKLPEKLKMEGRLMDLLLNRRTFDVHDWSAYTHEVQNRDDFYVREMIKKKIDANDALRDLGVGAKPDLLDQLADVALEVVRERTLARREFVVDDITRLKLPPDARTPYQRRMNKYGKDGKRVGLAEFLRLEWGDYTAHHLLYAEHIRDRDPSLYKALHYQAQASGVPFQEFLFAHGILGKDHLLNPPAGYERQAQLLQSLRFSSRAAALDRIAQQLSRKTYDSGIEP